MFIPDKDETVTEDGCEMTFQSNYFGHFLLTLLLLGKNWCEYTRGFYRANRIKLFIA